MFTAIFWKRTIENMVKAFATAFLLTASGLELISNGAQFGLEERALTGAIQAIGALAFALVGSQTGDQTNPSLLPSPPEQARDSKGRFRN